MNEQQITDMVGQTLYAGDGEKVGKIGQVYLDDVTGRPEWVTVQTGLFGTKESFVPIGQSQTSGDGMRVSYGKDTIKDAPQLDADGHLSREQESELYRYYGIEGSDGNDDQSYDAQPVSGDARVDDGGFRDKDAVGHDTSGPTTDHAMTRSEERLRVGTEKAEAGRARLRKHVVTENVTKTVPVTHEEVRVEREPITDANIGDAMAGPEISEEEHEVVLNEERVVTAKETVPVERVRIAKEQVTEQQQVTEQVRSEQIEVDPDDRR